MATTVTLASIVKREVAQMNNQSNLPTVAAIIPVRNRADQVVTCLNALETQTYRKFSVIVVDDCSTDATAEAVIQWANSRQFPCVEVLRNKKPVGPSLARNQGVAHACAEFVCFTDSDCVVDETWIEELVDAVSGPDGKADGASGVVTNPPACNWTEVAYQGTNRIGESAHRRPFQLCNLMLRRSVALDFPFDEAIGFYGEEDDLGWRLQRAGFRLTFAPDARVEHQHHHRFSSYLRQAWTQSRGTARLCYKQGVYLSRDLWFLSAAFAVVPLALLYHPLLAICGLLLGLHVLALIYNEVALKGKRFLTGLAVLPIIATYNGVKAVGVYWNLSKIFLGLDPEIVASRNAWRESRRGASRDGCDMNA